MSKLLVDEISDADNTGPVTVTDGLTVQGAFTSLGIDDNATSTAITLDASGNLLVGKTSAATNVQGGELRENGQVLAVATDINPFFGARLGSDGDLAVFRKDGTTVGSIGTAGGTITIDGGGTSSGIYFGENQLVPRDNGAGSNNVVDLGQSGNSFKDLYLSGGVYLGGTGSANKLDDYEEGTWLPTIEFATPGGTATTAPSSYTTGSYTKVGDIVTVEFNIGQIVFGNGTGHLQMSLPFTHVGITAYPGKSQASSGYTVAADTASGYSGVLKAYGVGPLNLMYDSGTSWDFITNSNASTISPNSINGQFTYHTNQ